MAPPIVDRVAGVTKTRWWGLLIALLIVATVTVVALQQRSFVSHVRAVATSNVDYLMLCGFRQGVTYEPCQLFDSQNLVGPLAHLASAATHMPPSKATPAKEMMLRVGRGPVTANQYLACFRVVRFADAQDVVYISEVTTDPACTRIQEYQAGYVAIPKGSLGHGAI
jgi:hypothetical protein